MPRVDIWRDRFFNGQLVKIQNEPDDWLRVAGVYRTMIDVVGEDGEQRRVSMGCVRAWCPDPYDKEED